MELTSLHRNSLYSSYLFPFNCSVLGGRTAKPSVRSPRGCPGAGPAASEPPDRLGLDQTLGQHPEGKNPADRRYWVSPADPRARREGAALRKGSPGPACLGLLQPGDEATAQLPGRLAPPDARGALSGGLASEGGRWER